MPRYDYRCTTCGHLYEKREGFDAPAVQECPECSGTARRVLTPPAIVFKGSGWYVTDSRKGGGSDGSTSAGSSTSKTDSPAPSTESTTSTTNSDTATKTEKTSS